MTLETGRPKSVKFHEPSKQEVDLVKSIPQGGLGVAWPARVQMRVRQDHCREPGLQGGGRGGGGGVGLPAAPVVRKINTEVNSKGKGLFCLLLSRVDYFQHKPIATTTKAAGIFPHGHALCSEGRQRG